MAGNKENKFNDGASSDASFEDVGARPLSDNTVSTVHKNKETCTDEEVPDVRYVLQYRGLGGSIVETRNSDKPFDVAAEIADNVVASKQPVLEILTTVSATVKKTRKHPVIHYDDEFTETESECSDDDEVRSPFHKIDRTEMVIFSRHLINALNAIINHYPNTNFYGDSVRIEAPYTVLFHYRDALNRYKISQPACHSAEYAATTSKHIDVVLNFLSTTFGDKIRDEENRHKNNPPAATFDWLWLLLKPGEVIYTKVQNIWTPFVISFVENVRDSDQKLTSYTVQCWNIRFSQGRMRRCMNSFSVRAFSGEQAIHTLNVVPAAFFPEELERERQIALGKMYWELVQKPAYKEYDGELVEKHGFMGGKITGRVVVDADGFHRFSPMAPGVGNQARPSPPMPGRHCPPPPRDQLPQFSPRCSCSSCSKGDRQEDGVFAGFEDLNPNEDKPPKNYLYFLVCATDIPAFVLGERRWAHVSLDKLKEVKSDREAFKYLVLDSGIKLTVKALIGKFASSDGKVSPWPNDFVKNKGEGRIFLLHGSPGVGKTCTAECVAELTHRPLLSLTSGDISTSMSSTSVERNLHYFLQLGERYGALVLLDEADVYLEERRTKDLHRNGLVSIFLRALEYYRGVLFLTTNRVEAFDSAFTSRIHVALHYKKLTDEDRRRIWVNNFDRLERDSAGKVFVGSAAKEFAFEGEDVSALKWNGREIRNALQTAVALAETEAMDDGLDKVILGEKHLRQVVKMSKGFRDFLRKRRGYDDDEDEDSDDEEDGDDDGTSSCVSRD